MTGIDLQKVLDFIIIVIIIIIIIIIILLISGNKCSVLVDWNWSWELKPGLKVWKTSLKWSLVKYNLVKT